MQGSGIIVVAFGSSQVESGSHSTAERRRHAQDSSGIASLVGLDRGHHVVNGHREDAEHRRIVLGHGSSTLGNVISVSTRAWTRASECSDRLLVIDAKPRRMDAETFDEQKYVDFFPQLQQAYKNAFSRMSDEYDSTLVHGIDQQVLNESEPFYDDGADAFYLELPEDPHDRLTGITVDADRLETVLEAYVEEIEAELERTFE